MTPREIARAILQMVAAGPRAWLESLRVVTVRDAGGWRDRVRMAALAVVGARLGAAARKEGWAHLHVHSCGDAAFIALFARIFGGLTYSLTLHSRLGCFGVGQVVKWNRSSFGIAVTPGLKEELFERVQGLPEAHTEVCAMGVDLAVFRRAIPYVAWPGDRPLHLVSCGRLHEGKGHQQTIEAVAMLRERGIEARLTILGEGPARSDLERLIRHGGLVGAVHLRGAVPERVVREALESAHIFVLASHDEAMPVAIMEAMAMALPVVATRVGGVNSLVRDNVDGVIVPAREPRALVQAIEEIARDSATALRMSTSGEARARTGFSSRRSAELIVSRMRRL